MLDYAESVTKLIDEFKRLPGIGHKTAQRLAFYIMRVPEAEVERFVEALMEVKRRIIFCSVCNNLTDVDPCRFCASTSRDRSMICVVEEPHNLVSVEKTLLRHRFAFTAGNQRRTTVDQYAMGIPLTGNRPKDIFLGFNIMRQWKLK